MYASMAFALITSRTRPPDWKPFFPRLISQGSKCFLTASSIGIASSFASVTQSMNLQGPQDLRPASVADAGNLHQHRNAIRFFAGSHCASTSHTAVQSRLPALLFRVGPEGKSCSGSGAAKERATVAQSRGL